MPQRRSFGGQPVNRATTGHTGSAHMPGGMGGPPPQPLPPRMPPGGMPMAGPSGPPMPGMGGPPSPLGAGGPGGPGGPPPGLGQPGQNPMGGAPGSGTVDPFDAPPFLHAAMSTGSKLGPTLEDHPQGGPEGEGVDRLHLPHESTTTAEDLNADNDNEQSPSMLLKLLGMLGPGAMAGGGPNG